MTVHVETRNVRRDNSADVGKNSFMALCYALLLCGGVAAALRLRDPVWLTVSLAAAAALLMLVWRLTEHDRRAFNTRARTEERPLAADEPETLIRPTVRRNAGNYKIGRWTVSVADWNAVGRAALSRQDRRVVRSSLPSGGLPDVVRTFPEFADDLVRLDLLEKRVVGNRDAWYMTARGEEEWFRVENFWSAELPPPRGERPVVLDPPPTHRT